MKWIARSFRPTTVCCFIWCSVSKWKTIPHVGQLTRHKTIYFSLLLPVVCRPCFPLGCQGCWHSCSWRSASGPHVWLLLGVIYVLKDRCRKLWCEPLKFSLIFLLNLFQSWEMFSKLYDGVNLLRVWFVRAVFVHHEVWGAPLSKSLWTLGC